MTRDRPAPPDRCLRLRTRAERDAFGAATHYARVHDLSEPPESAYLEALPEARREIRRRLVRGLLRGRPAGLPDHCVLGPDPDAEAIPDCPSPLPRLTADRLRSLVAPTSDGRRLLALLPFPASETVLVAPIAVRHGYDRYRFAGPVYRWSADADEPAAVEHAHPIDLVPLLEREGAFADADQADRIRGELAESVANLALARLAGAVQAGAIDDSDATASSLERIASGVRSADRATAFERIVTDGHPFHPAGKIRRGTTPAEGLAYAPEFTDRIDLRFVAIERADAKETRADGSDRLTDRLLATFEGLERALERAIPAGRTPDEYAIVPVHPLQFHRTIPDRYAGRIDDGRVVPLPDYARGVTPQLNLRTVVPFGTADGPLPHLKLAIPVQTTNVVRTLSPHAVTNGPQVTDVLRAIDRRESFGTLGFLAEPAATCYHPPGGPHPDGEGFDDARHLSGLVRTNPAAHRLVPDGAVPVVASSLVASDPATGRPLVCELIDQFRRADQVTMPDVGAAKPSLAADRTDEAALEFIERYAAVVVPEQLSLLCEYGIALESHLQNSLIVVDRATATPLATLVRDLGGIRVHRNRLASHGLSIDPYPDSDLDADGEADLHRKLYYALFQNHLAELVATVAHAYGVDERACWERIRAQCDRAFERVRAEGVAPDERIARDERALFEAPATHKALTAMRLQGKRHEYVTSEVSNPLSRAGRERIEPSGSPRASESESE
ncbi:Siderophore synthetase component [Halobiforma haloterrestris]|uniref:Siderophore synthetase component n=1 Tax=Natronobacterium haloterrestre TaxID=148448 RepID=A0A1I1DQ40_NATHA|nr:IucA/IucC family protein [Halobiforma haloterrestris]SFB75148.1 Siderophore synthetase component [Halobiforma haloterrestris]